MMKKKIIIVYILIFFSVSCKKDEGLYSYKSFGFEDLTDSYNSGTGVYKRKYSNDTIEIKIVLTKEEREIIIKSFSGNNFFELADKINCKLWGNPVYYDILFLDNHIVSYENSFSEDKWFCPSGKRFNEINTLMQKIIFNKQEIKKLKPSDIAYE
jgi:hypothetical protein